MSAVDVWKPEDVRWALVHRDFVPEPTISAVDVPTSLPLLLQLEGAPHTSHRRSISRPMTRRALAPWLRRFAETATDLALGIDPGSTAELGTALAWPLAEACVIRYLGVDERVARELLPDVRVILQRGVKKHRLAYSAMRLHRDVSREIERIPCETMNPQTLLGQLLASDTPRDDVLSAAMTMLVAGTELTARGILACLSDLSTHPTDSPTVLPDYVIDRAVAHASILPYVERRALRAIDGPIVCPSDALVRLHICPTQQRSVNASSLPFGLGHHYCLGAHWVRTVVRAAHLAMSSAFETYRVTSKTREDSGVLPSGIVALEVSLGACRPAAVRRSLLDSALTLEYSI